MDETIFDKVQEIDLKKTMEQSYIDYAMSVISQRAVYLVNGRENRN